MGELKVGTPTLNTITALRVRILISGSHSPYEYGVENRGAWFQDRTHHLTGVLHMTCARGVNLGCSWVSYLTLIKIPRCLAGVVYGSAAHRRRGCRGAAGRDVFGAEPDITGRGC